MVIHIEKKRKLDSLFYIISELRILDELKTNMWKEKILVLEEIMRELHDLKDREDLLNKCQYTQTQGKSLRLKICLHKWRAEKDQRKSLATLVWKLIEFIKRNLNMRYILGSCKTTCILMQLGRSSWIIQGKGWGE